MSSKLTARQAEALKSFGIEGSYLPISKKAACVLISFLVKGNGTVGNNAFERAAYYRQFHDNWVGQSVEYYDGRTGKVKSVIARKREEVARIREGIHDSRPAPFTLWLAWEDGTYSSVCVSDVEKRT